MTKPTYPRIRITMATNQGWSDVQEFSWKRLHAAEQYIQDQHRHVEALGNLQAHSALSRRTDVQPNEVAILTQCRIEAVYPDGTQELMRLPDREIDRSHASLADAMAHEANRVSTWAKGEKLFDEAPITWAEKQAQERGLRRQQFNAQVKGMEPAVVASDESRSRSIGR